MAAKKTARRSGPKLSPEVKAAYAEVQSGVKHLGKAVGEVQRGLRSAERQIEAEARARIQALRKDAREQLAGLKTRQRDLTKTLRGLGAAAQGSWQEVKASADSVLAEARETATSVVDRFRNALGR